MTQPEITWHFSGAPIQPNVSTKVMSAYRKSRVFMSESTTKKKQNCMQQWGAKFIILYTVGQMGSKSTIMCVVQYPTYVSL